jgi:hypothetical protein
MAAEVAAGITQQGADDALIAGAFGDAALTEEPEVTTQGGVGIDPTLSVDAPEVPEGEEPVDDGFPPAPTGPITEEPAAGDEDDEDDEVDEDGNITLPDGQVVSIARLRELAQLDAAFRTNPAVQGAVERAVRENGLLPGATPAPPPVGGIPGGYPQGVVPPPPAAPPVVPQFQPLPTFELPADIDPQDPTVMWVQAQQRAMAEQNQQLMAGQQAILANMQQQAQATAASSLERARADFQGRYPTLSFDDVAQIEAQAGARGLGGHFMRQYGDPYKAALESLEVQAGSMAELRPKLFAAAPTGGNVTPIDKAKQQTRAKAHRAIAGKGGTAPRTEPAQPRKLSQSEKEAAMAGVIAQAMQAN